MIYLFIYLCITRDGSQAQHVNQSQTPLISPLPDRGRYQQTEFVRRAAPEEITPLELRIAIHFIAFYLTVMKSRIAPLSLSLL